MTTATQIVVVDRGRTAENWRHQRVGTWHGLENDEPQCCEADRQMAADGHGKGNGHDNDARKVTEFASDQSRPRSLEHMVVERQHRDQP